MLKNASRVRRWHGRPVFDLNGRFQVSSKSLRFPFEDVFDVNGEEVDSATVIDLLEPYISDARKETILRVDFVRHSKSILFALGRCKTDF